MSVFAPIVNDPHRNGDTSIVPTDDLEVRQELRELGEPITLFGEREADRRDRLIRLLSERKHTNFEVAEVENSDNSLEYESEEEEFYTPGLEQLLEARKYILETSVTAAAQRLQKQRRIANEYDALRTLKHRRHINQELYQFELNGSYTLQGNSRALSGAKIKGDKVACASWDGNFYIMKRELPEVFTQISRLSPGYHSEKVTLAWSPTDDVIVSGGAEGKVNIWKADEEKLKPIFLTLAHLGRIAKTAFHPSGKYVASTSYDQTWKLWDITRPETELLEQEGHDKEVYACSFHPDGSILATGGLDAIGRIWDLRSGRSISTLEGHIKGIYSMDWSPNGHHLASASGDCSVKIWDMRKTSAELFSIPAHTKLVSEVCFLQSTPTSPLAQPETDEDGNNPRVLDVSGTYIASSSYDGTVKLWSADNWVAIKTLRGHTDKVMSCDVSDDGLYIVSCGWDRVLRVWSKI